MKYINWIIIASAIALLAFWGFQKTDSPKENGIVDIFEGKIDNTSLEGNILFGNITYDRNCKSVGNGLLHCDAGVKTEKFGVINFDYTHNMSKQPCLVDGDKILLKVKKDKKAYAIR